MMNTRKKGNRIENKAVKELEANGWIVYRVKGSTKFNKDVDIFGLFDIMARNKIGKRTKWIQVKSNQKPNFTAFAEFKDNYCTTFDSVEIWVWKDRKGFIKHVI